MTFPPEFPGGNQALNAWLIGNTHYPKKAFKKKIQGTSYVSFVVERDGRIVQVTLRRGCDPLLDKEALRVVEKMPAWNPGRLQDSSLVRVRYTLPIQFKLAKPAP